MIVMGPANRFELSLKQARIVAMTCTHAAMTRGRLVELGFKYDRLVDVSIMFSFVRALRSW
jgi:hypothetical protein